MFKIFKKVCRDERGVSALEYAMLAAVIVAALAGVGTIFGTNSSTGLGKVFDSIMTKLGIGALMGLRVQEGASGAPMRPCKLIGVAPNDAILMTLPYVDGRPMELTPGENVDIVAVASQAVYRFVCTLDAMCHAPFGYLVLSKPANVRMLRERQSIRVRAQFPVRYGMGGESGYRGVALARGVSALGMSLCAPWAIGKVGERLRIGFRLRSGMLDTAIETSAVVRNGHPDDGADPQYLLGLELDTLTPVEQMAMKVYMFDRRDDVLFWTSGPR